MADPVPDSSAPARPPLAVLVATVAVVVLVVVGVVVWQVRGAQDPSAACASSPQVEVSVAPALADAVRSVFSQPGAVAARCVQVDVVSTEPAGTLTDVLTARTSRQPDIWVPDSTLWLDRAAGAPVTSVGTFATTPLLVASSRAVLDRLGWTTTPPSWAQVLLSGVPLALPDVLTSGDAVPALAAMYTSLGGGTPADEAVTTTVLSNIQGAGPDLGDALAAGRIGFDSAPVSVLTEQQVLASGTDSQLVAVYPSDGSPRIEAPILQVGAPEGARRAAVTSVVDALTSYLGQAAAATAGFRDVSGTAPPGADGTAGVLAREPAVMLVNSIVVQGVLDDLNALLAKNTRFLVVVDSSESMGTPVGTDGTRATLTRDAATDTLLLFQPEDQVGAWIYAYHLDGDTDHLVISPPRPLTGEVDGVTQRDFLLDQLTTLPNRLTPGGSALYDTTLAAIRSARATYDPTFVNTVVIISDGPDDDPQGIGGQALLETLRSENDPTRPLEIVLVGLGPDADMPALQQIADASGGSAYLSYDPGDLPSVLINALRKRR